MNAKQLPADYPQFFARAEGCHLIDVDGRRFTDLMCSWGPIVLGYGNVAVDRAALEQAGDDLAAILVSAFRHDFGLTQELPTAAFAARVRALADETGAALILDDVRAGFRLDLGGSWEPLGVQPDLSAWSKAIANGYALSAVTGRERFREAATQVFATGSFWCSAVPMAAAVATLTELRRLDGPTRLRSLGERLREGLAERAERHGVRIEQSGPVQMPTLLFEDDPEWKRGSAFCAEVLRQRVYMHPKHNMFLSCAHTEADIDDVVEAADAGFECVAR